MPETAGSEKFKGQVDKAKGVVKENVGHLIGNKELEGKGMVQRAEGEARVEGAKTAEYTKGTVESLKGTVKEKVGDLTGDKSLQGEGMVDKAKGEARKATNK